MDALIEKMAREFAEALVTQSDEGYDVFVGTTFSREFRSVSYAAAQLGDLRDAVAEVIAAALHRFLMMGPTPSPVSEERLEQIADRQKPICDGREVIDLLLHVQHLAHLVACMSAESEGQAYCAGHTDGRKSGAREQREADAEAARKECNQILRGSGYGEDLTREDAGYPYFMPVSVRDAAKAAPLVTDAKEATR